MNESGTISAKRWSFLTAVVVLTLSLPAVWALPGGYWPESGGYALVQLGCTAVAAVICVVGIRAFAEQGSYRLLLMGLAFLCFGVLDLLHSLTAPGEPEFPLGGGENVSLWFNQLSRLLGSLLLLWSVLLPVGLAHPGLANSWRAIAYTALTGALLLTIALALPGTARSAPMLWEPVNGLTDLRRALELVALALQLVVTVSYFRLWERRHQDVLLLFALGMVGLALAGAAQIAQHNFYDVVFWLAYGYRLFAYGCFGAGIWTLVRPTTRHAASD